MRISVIEKNNTKKNWNICQKKIMLKKIGISVIEKNNTKKNWNIQSRAKSIRGIWRTSRLSCLALAILNLGKSKIS
jgi:hypothetical protein